MEVEPLPCAYSCSTDNAGYRRYETTVQSSPWVSLSRHTHNVYLTDIISTQLTDVRETSEAVRRMTERLYRQIVTEDV